MATKIDFAFSRLEMLVEKYCREEKLDDAIEAVTWAWEYAHDFPKDADIKEAIRLVKKAENYLTEEGKPIYAKVRAELATRLRQMLYDRKKKAVKITTMDNTIPKKKNGQLDERKKLADRIKQARESSHISQRALGKSVGVSDKSISSYEHARSLPPLDILTKIALRTRKPLTFFIEEKTATSDITSKLKRVEKELKEIHALLDKISKNKDNSLEVPIATEQL
jgi:transcriptional regulator with XRE-family HTH domain